MTLKNTADILIFFFQVNHLPKSSTHRTFRICSEVQAVLNFLDKIHLQSPNLTSNVIIPKLGHHVSLCVLALAHHTLHSCLLKS